MYRYIAMAMSIGPTMDSSVLFETVSCASHAHHTDGSHAHHTDGRLRGGGGASFRMWSGRWELVSRQNLGYALIRELVCELKRGRELMKRGRPQTFSLGSEKAWE